MNKIVNKNDKMIYCNSTMDLILMRILINIKHKEVKTIFETNLTFVSFVLQND